jgi:hypothetical protein
MTALEKLFHERRKLPDNRAVNGFGESKIPGSPLGFRPAYIPVPPK